MTKKYTLNLLISEVSNLSNAQTSSYSALASALSPRAGRRSAKLRVLNAFLGGSTARIVNGTSSAFAGRSGRTRLLRALRARKSSN